MHMQNYCNGLDTCDISNFFPRFLIKSKLSKKVTVFVLKPHSNNEKFRVKKDIYPILTNVRTVYNIANVNSCLCDNC